MRQIDWFGARTSKKGLECILMADAQITMLHGGLFINMFRQWWSRWKWINYDSNLTRFWWWWKFDLLHRWIGNKTLCRMTITIKTKLAYYDTAIWMVWWRWSFKKTWHSSTSSAGPGQGSSPESSLSKIHVCSGKWFCLKWSLIAVIL